MYNVIYSTCRIIIKTYYDSFKSYMQLQTIVLDFLSSTVQCAKILEKLIKPAASETIGKQNNSIFRTINLSFLNN